MELKFARRIRYNSKAWDDYRFYIMIGAPSNPTDWMVTSTGEALRGYRYNNWLMGIGQPLTNLASMFLLRITAKISPSFTYLLDLALYPCLSLCGCYKNTSICTQTTDPWILCFRHVRLRDLLDSETDHLRIKSGSNPKIIKMSQISSIIQRDPEHDKQPL